jgi:putative transposase
LVKELRVGQLVVMDNINFHHTKKVKDLIESVGCKILFLPTYLPDLNPIEHYWFKIKQQSRKSAGNFSDFFQAVWATLADVAILSG